MPRRLSREAARVAAATANPVEVGAWAEDLPERFLLCRDLGHTWRPFLAKFDTEERAYKRVLKCGRCRTERTQLISMNGVPLSGAYDYPDGYTAPTGAGRLDSSGRGALRLVSIQRLIEKSEG